MSDIFLYKAYKIEQKSLDLHKPQSLDTVNLFYFYEAIWQMIVYWYMAEIWYAYIYDAYTRKYNRNFIFYNTCTYTNWQSSQSRLVQERYITRFFTPSFLFVKANLM